MNEVRALPPGSDAVLLETAWDRVSGNAAMHETFVKVRKQRGDGNA